MKASAIILAGGKSSRMGSNKALLEFNNKTNIERIKDEMSGFAEVILVTNEPETYKFLGLKTVSDEYPGLGPLAGIHAGLMASASEINILVACDMPFVTSDLAAALVEKAGSYDAVVPVIEGRQHPLFAVYRKSIISRIEECLNNKNLRIKHLLESLNVLYLNDRDFQAYNSESLDRIFYNMNHPEEYENAKKWAEAKE
ncbi:molybdenum cofactor guanylyltransferase [Mesobacillus harenae]|uniref:molybdenum cofactor guanylyltransferase n=1 Tax=Mesobacillus harenae TaxID=2213203 RepID=UPI001580B8A6|nr:molybdenum cofactor guanylyltransferase [Mesobacillus harenae]